MYPLTGSEEIQVKTREEGYRVIGAGVERALCVGSIRAESRLEGIAHTSGRGARLKDYKERARMYCIHQAEVRAQEECDEAGGWAGRWGWVGVEGRYKLWLSSQPAQTLEQRLDPRLSRVRHHQYAHCPRSGHASIHAPAHMRLHACMPPFIHPASSCDAAHPRPHACWSCRASACTDLEGINIALAGRHLSRCPSQPRCSRARAHTHAPCADAQKRPTPFRHA